MLMVSEWMSLGHWWSDAESTEVLGEKCGTSDTLSATNPPWTGLGLNLDFCSERLVANHLSHDTALWLVVLSRMLSAVVPGFGITCRLGWKVILFEAYYSVYSFHFYLIICEYSGFKVIICINLVWCAPLRVLVRLCSDDYSKKQWLYSYLTTCTLPSLGL